MKIGSRTLSTLAVALAFTATPAIADDESSDSFKVLSAQWWQWAVSIPAAVNPLSDTSGEFCMVGQRGSVWFLAGSTTGQFASRICSVPEGMPLFFPVINTVWINTPVCDGLVLSVAELRAKAAADIDGATGLAVLLDNSPVGNLRAFARRSSTRHSRGAICSARTACSARRNRRRWTTAITCSCAG